MEALSINFKPGIQTLQPLSPPISLNGATSIHKHPVHVSTLGRSANGVSLETSVDTSRSKFSLADPLRSLWQRRGGGGDGEEKRNAQISLTIDEEDVEEEEEEEEEEEGTESGVEGDENEPTKSEKRNGNWVLKILRIGSIWDKKDGNLGVIEEEEEQNCPCCEDGKRKEDCGASEEEVKEEKMEFDRDSFSKLLKKVSLAEARLYAQMSYLGNLAYAIPSIKPEILLTYQGLRFVTSSLEKKAEALNTEKDQTLNQVQETNQKVEEAQKAVEHKKKSEIRLSASAAYRIAATAASYVQCHTRSIFPFKLLKGRPSKATTDGYDQADGRSEVTSSEMASFVATTNSLTAVVAAKEEMKQAVAKDLNSVHSSPCEWFMCDDDQSGTRFIAIQGSDTVSSWQANLLFEPIEFEGLNVLVHRGIYEAAKGIFEQVLPEVRAHLKSCGESATFRFTGHSLGGSLSLLVNLMLLIRGEVPPSSLLPVITFGSPTIMCGGDQLLRKLGLPRNHVQAITLHRDIVPRAFSCYYPNHVIEILKAVNGNFRDHPCLKNQKLLYTPMGEILILQPDEKISPHHDLLPSGNGLYILSCPMSDLRDPEKLIRAAQNVFFNSPHPLDILSDKSSYGSSGAIYRDHDMKAYLRSVRGVIRQELSRIRKEKREQRRRVWWPLLVPQDMHTTGITVGRQVVSGNVTQQQLKLFGVLHAGAKSLKRFSRLVASQHINVLVVLLFPARLVLLGAQTIFSSH